MGAKSSREEQPPAAAPAAAGAPPVGMNRRRRVSVSAEVDKVETPMKKKFVVKDAETVAEVGVGCSCHEMIHYTCAFLHHFCGRLRSSFPATVD
jgi:hypothetical protein